MLQRANPPSTNIKGVILLQHQNERTALGQLHQLLGIFIALPYMSIKDMDGLSSKELILTCSAAVRLRMGNVCIHISTLLIHTTVVAENSKVFMIKKWNMIPV